MHHFFKLVAILLTVALGSVTQWELQRKDYTALGMIVGWCFYVSAALLIETWTDWS